jgi:uncharacterized delta-60 repeat protein
MTRSWFALVALGTLLASPPARATIGTVDRSFFASLPNTTMWRVDALVQQPDQKLVIAGWRLEDRLVVARFEPDGALDATFGSGGIVTTLVGTDSRAYAAALQPDGKIVVAGWSDSGPTIDFLLLRYQTDGTLDPAFGAGGVVTTSLAGVDFGYALAIRSDGRIIVAGQACTGTSCPLAIARYDSAGALDPTFGTGGKLITSFGGASGIDGGPPDVRMALQPDNKMLFNGHGVVRLLEDGTPDPTFGSSGLALFEIGPPSITAIEVQPDGNILAGHVSKGIARLTASGELDTSFGKDGFARVGAQDIALAPDGRIVSTAYQSPCPLKNESADLDYYCGTPVDRVNADGTIDTTFGVGGGAEGELGAEQTGGRAVIVRADGKIVAVGFGNQAVSLSRWLVDGCTQAIKPKFSIVHQFTSVGSRLSLVGTLQIPGGPAIDPAANGLRLELADGEGNVIYTRTVPGGGSWSVNGRGTAWKYSNPAGPGGIQTIRVLSKASKPGQVKIVLKARDASYGYQSVWLPPKVRVTFDYLAPTPTQCSEASFYLGYCVLTGEEETLKCSSP